MAESGIKISQLNVVTPKNDGSDYTILVQDGITGRSYLSAINNYMTNGSYNTLSESINKNKTDINALSGNIKKINNNINNIIDQTNHTESNLNYINNNLNNNISDLSNNINNLTKNLNDFQSNIEENLSVLTNDKNIIASINSLAELITSGELPLEEIISNINDISSNLNVLSVIANNNSFIIQNILSDFYSRENDKLYNNISVEINGDLSILNDYLSVFYYDENRYLNVEANGSFRVNENASTNFSLSALPIRGGMFNFRDDGSKITDLYFNAYVSGNSDVDIYFAKDAKLLNGIENNIKMTIEINGKRIARRKLKSNTSTDDTDLELIYSGRVKGGSNIIFYLDRNELDNLNNNDLTVLLNTNGNLKTLNTLKYNLIGAIRSTMIPSEKNEITGRINSITKTNNNGYSINYTYSGGVTGDSYILSIMYGDNITIFNKEISINNISNMIVTNEIIISEEYITNNKLQSYFENPDNIRIAFEKE